MAVEEVAKIEWSWLVLGRWREDEKTTRKAKESREAGEERQKKAGWLLKRVKCTVMCHGDHMS